MDALKKKLAGKRAVKESQISVEEVAALITAGSVKNVVICAGAGISTSAGIPDFRSPETGLYHNLERFKLDYPEQVFEIDFFRKNPEPFFELARELYPGKFAPTTTHNFIRLLYEKHILLRCFTQNIDTLERRAGVPADYIVEAHGSFAESHCISARCGLKADAEETKITILDKKIPRCRKCKALVKPDIVFFGESLPRRFYDRLQDLKDADLLIVMGTSLQVQPFASLPDRVSRDCPRLLLNLEDVGDFSRDLDVVSLTDCDQGCRDLANACGWLKELEMLDKQVKKDATNPVADDTSTSKTDSLEILPVTDTVEGTKIVDSIEISRDPENAENDVQELVEKIRGTNL